MQSFDLQIGPLSISKHVIKTTLIVKSDQFQLNYGIELERYQGLRSRASGYIASKLRELLITCDAWPK